MLSLGSLGVALKLNFQDYANEAEPYVYVQTFTDVNKLLVPLHRLVQRDPIRRHLRGHIILPEQYPFIWLLGDYPRIDFPTFDHLPDSLDADFLLIDDPLVEQIEPALRQEYFRMPMAIRGSSENRATLYLSAETFASLVPAETPKFVPGIAELPAIPNSK